MSNRAAYNFLLSISLGGKEPTQPQPIPQQSQQTSPVHSPLNSLTPPPPFPQADAVSSSLQGSPPHPLTPPFLPLSGSPPHPQLALHLSHRQLPSSSPSHTLSAPPSLQNLPTLALSYPHITPPSQPVSQPQPLPPPQLQPPPPQQQPLALPQQQPQPQPQPHQHQHVRHERRDRFKAKLSSTIERKLAQVSRHHSSSNPPATTTPPSLSPPTIPLNAVHTSVSAPTVSSIALGKPISPSLQMRSPPIAIKIPPSRNYGDGDGTYSGNVFATSHFPASFVREAAGGGGSSFGSTPGDDSPTARAGLNSPRRFVSDMESRMRSELWCTSTIERPPGGDSPRDHPSPTKSRNTPSVLEGFTLSKPPLPPLLIPPLSPDLSIPKMFDGPVSLLPRLPLEEHSLLPPRFPSPPLSPGSSPPYPYGSHRAVLNKSPSAIDTYGPKPTKLMRSGEQAELQHRGHRRGKSESHIEDLVADENDVASDDDGNDDGYDNDDPDLPSDLFDAELAGTTAEYFEKMKRHRRKRLSRRGPLLNHRNPAALDFLKGISLGEASPHYKRKSMRMRLSGGFHKASHLRETYRPADVLLAGTAHAARITIDEFALQYPGGKVYFTHGHSTFSVYSIVKFDASRKDKEKDKEVVVLKESQSGTSIGKLKSVSYAYILASPYESDQVETENGVWVKYVPFYLDDPSLTTGKHRTVMNLAGMKESVIPFVKPRIIKEELNELFRQKHPWVVFGVTLHKIRKLKKTLVIIAVTVGLEISTVAMAHIYFEKLIMQGMVTKPQIRLHGAVCLVLATKANDPLGADLRSLLEALTKFLFIEPKEMFQLEFSLFAALSFNLHLKAEVVLPHIAHIIKDNQDLIVTNPY